MRSKIDIFHTKKIAVFVVIVFVLSGLSYGRALQLNFWRDDWPLIWQAIYDREIFRSWILSIRHPGEILNSYLGAQFLGTNVFLWQLLGLFTKFISSLLVGLALYGLTRSRNAAVIAAIIYSSYYVGLESFTWVSARLTAYLIIVICLMVYFYAVSYFEKSDKKLVVALFLLAFAFFLEPGKVFILPLMLFAWELGNRFIVDKVINRNTLIRGSAVVTASVFGMVLTSFGRSFLFGKSGSGYVEAIIKNKSVIWNYFFSLGNLVSVYFRGLDEWAGLSVNVSKGVAVVGIVMVVAASLLLLLLLKKKNKYFPIILLVSIWIPLSYFPSWVSEMPLCVGASHRYMALSGVGVVWLVSSLLANVGRQKVTKIILGLIVISNLYFSFQVIGNDLEVRSFAITDNLYEKQFADVRRGGGQKLFIVTGEHYLRGYVFDWAMTGAIPFAFKSGIKKSNELPIFGVSYDMAGKLVCEENVNRPYIRDWVRQEKPISIQDTYIWMVDEHGQLVNITDMGRARIAHNSECYRVVLDKEITNGVILKSEIVLDTIYSENKRAISFDWIIDKELIDSLNITLSIYSKRNELIGEQDFKLENIKVGYDVTTLVIDDQFEPYLSSIRVAVNYKEKLREPEEVLYTVIHER